MFSPTRVIAVLALGLALMGTLGSAAPSPIKVATSFSIIDDLVRQVGGDRVRITNFVPRNGDTHTYEPGARDVKALSESRLVFVNGLGLEGWFGRLLKNAATKARVVTLSDGLKTIGAGSTHESGTHEGEGHSADPHLWWDLRHTQAYVTRIAAELGRADPAGRATFEANAKAYRRTLMDLDAWATGQISSIPKARRKLVTNHDALGYFAARYGFTVIGNVIPSLGTERSPSAKELATLTNTIRREGVKAIFTENTLNAKLAQTIAEETGARIAPPLYTDSLDEAGSKGSSFAGAFRHNVSTIVSALK